jgi:protocatechuate 3,4-dioxygenase beta subunit/polyisoprenoid-binding protein YceI
LQVIPGTEARFRVREQLAELNFPNDAVGVTQRVEGAITLDQNNAIVVADSRLVVDLRTLQSDDSGRDRYINRRTLETDRYPLAEFVPREVAGLPTAWPRRGEAQFQVVGDLTIHGTTKPLTWNVSASFGDQEVVGLAVTSFRFGDFNMTIPKVFLVLSVEDNIGLEVDFRLGRRETDLPKPALAPAPTLAFTPAPTPVVARSPVVERSISPCGTNSVTPSQTAGPYFKPGSPTRQSLLEPGAGGVKIVITGQVFSRDCKPMTAALLDFWQANDQGEYDNAGYRLRGHQFTDSEGQYRLETVVPGQYSGRTRHIHVNVAAPNGALLTTQLYLHGEARNSQDWIFDERLTVAIQDTADGKLATFNFVLDAR